MASSVLRTIRSSVPCRMSDLLSPTVAPVGWLEECSVLLYTAHRNKSSTSRVVGGGFAHLGGRQARRDHLHDRAKLGAATPVFGEQYQLLEQVIGRLAVENRKRRIAIGGARAVTLRTRRDVTRWLAVRDQPGNTAVGYLGRRGSRQTREIPHHLVSRLIVELERLGP